MVMVVTLIGYRASGKSSVAPRLARKLGWSWVDCDDVIEQRAGASIKDIFEHEGEAGFRQRESEILAELLQQSDLVIASGGGAILAESNRKLIRAAGPVVWLQAILQKFRLPHRLVQHQYQKMFESFYPGLQKQLLHFQKAVLWV